MHKVSIQSSGKSAALHVLREQTRDLHAQLDSQSNLSKLIDPECSLDDFVRATLSLVNAYQGVDSCLAEGAGCCPPGLPAYLPRLPYLLADLEWLGIKPTHIEIFRLPTPSSFASYLGVRYVVEGSNLGSRVIYRSLLNSEVARHIAVENCFWSRSQAGATSWPLLLRQLNNLQRSEEWEEAANSARSVFEHFIHHLALKRK